MTPTIIIIVAILVLTLLHMWLERRPATKRAPEIELSHESGAALTAPMIVPAGTSFDTPIEGASEAELNWKNEPEFEVEMASPPQPQPPSTARPKPEFDEFEPLPRDEEVEQVQEIQPQPQAEPEFMVIPPAPPVPEPEPEPHAQPDLEVEIPAGLQRQSDAEFEVRSESRPLQPEPSPQPQPESECELEAEPEPQPEPLPQPQSEPLTIGQTGSEESPAQESPAQPHGQVAEVPQLPIAAPAPTTDTTGPRLHTEASSAESPPLDAVIAGLEKIAPLPQSVHQILEELESEVSSAHIVGDILSSDSTIGAALVRVVNSAALGVPRRILTVHEAVSYLGFSTVRTIILRLKLAGLFAPPKVRRHCYDTAELWAHSTAVSAVADVLAKRVNCNAELHIDAALASTLGLLHDVGRLAVNSQFPLKVAELRPRKSATKPAGSATAGYENVLTRERRIFGADHAFIGGLLAARWQVPDQLADGIRLHHLPAGQALDNLSPPLYRAVVLVHIADQLVKLKHAYCHDMPFDVIPESLFTALNLPPSLDDLLDQPVCAAIAQATAISHELSLLPKPRKRLSA